MRRVCSFDFIAGRNAHGKNFLGDPFLKCLHRFLSLSPRAHKQRDTHAPPHTPLIPQLPDPAPNLPRQACGTDGAAALRRHARYPREALKLLGVV